MRLIRLALLLVASATVASCSSTREAGVVLSSKYLGKKAQTFFLDHGAPAAALPLPNDQTIYTWSSAPKGAVSVQSTFCEVTILASADGTITEIKPTKDTFGDWVISKCVEVFGP